MAGNDANTKVLLHFDGSDGSTTITDDNAGGSAKTWTAVGNAQIDTAQSKFGGASLLLDGTGDAVETPDHADFSFGTIDFTVDAWVRPGATGVDGRIICHWENSGERAWTLEVTGANKFQFRAFDAAAASVILLTSTTTLAANTQYHVAVDRSGSNAWLYIDGTLEATDTSAGGTIRDSSVKPLVGAAWSFGLGSITDFFNGHIDELRVSSVARYGGSNFTPPTDAYSAPNTTITPAAAQLALSTVAPARVTDVRRDPAQGNLALSTVAPTVARTDHRELSPAAGQLALTAVAPGRVTDVRRDPSQGNVALSTVAPAIVQTTNVAAQPAAAQLALSATAPAVVQTTTVNAIPAAANLVLSAVAPTSQLHQYMRPDADVSDGLWTDQDGGSSLFAAVDEDPRSSADYIKSSSAPSADICRLRLSDPGSLPAVPFEVQYEYHKQGSGSIDLAVRLMQGATEIAAWDHTGISESETVATQELTAPQFAAITDFNALEIEFEANTA